MNREQLGIDNNRIDRRVLPALAKMLAKEALAMSSVQDYQSFCSRLEEKIAGQACVKDCILTHSGTDAMLLSLLSLGLRKNDEVIVPASAYIAVALAVHYAGARVVAADIAPHDFQMSPELVKEKISRKTRAIMMVHMFGQCCDITGFQRLVAGKKVALIENACQAWGTRWHGQMVGGFGAMGVLSFSYAKTLASLGGYGGALLLHDTRRKREIVERYIHVNKGHVGLAYLPGKVSGIGFLDAVSVRVKFDFCDDVEAKKRACLLIYDREFRGIPEIRILPDPPGVSSVRPFYLVVAKKRDSLYRFLRRQRISCEKSPMPGVALQELIRFRMKDFPVAVRLAQEGLRLPLFSLMEPEEAFYIARRVKEFYGAR